MKYSFKKVTVGLLLISILLIYSMYHAYINSELLNYLTTPLYSIINMVIAVVFAYFFTQSGNTLRNNMEVASHIIEKLLYDLNNERMWKISSEEDIVFVRIKQRTTMNRLNLLKEYEKTFDLTEKLDYASKNFSLYWDTISNNINNISSLSTSQIDLQNLLENVTSKLEETEVHIHKL